MSELETETTVGEGNCALVSEDMDKNETENNASHATVKKKSKKSKKSKEKRHFWHKKKSSRSSSSRKVKDFHKNSNTKSLRKKNKNIEKSSSENQSHNSTPQPVQDVLSDEPESPASANKTPLLRTRTRFQRRKTYSSYSSNAESDYRKTKSEPIIITLDSDSDDNISSCRRPNRTARIKGEFIRKLGTTDTKESNYETCDSSSSTDYEEIKRKKKNKTRSVKSSSSHIAKRKKYLVIARQSRLKVRKHISRVYRPSRIKRDLRSVKKRFEDQKKVKRSTRSCSSLKTRSQRNSTSITKRWSLRHTSVDSGADIVLKNDTESEVSKGENEAPKTLSKVKEPAVKDEIEEVETEEVETNPKNSKKIRNSIESDLQQIKEGKIESSDPGDITMEAKDADVEADENKFADDDNKFADDDDNKSADDDGNKSAADDDNKFVADDENKSVADDDKFADNSNQTEETKISVEKPNLANNYASVSIKKIKKKIKPVDRIIRKRGRPRLTDIKYMKNNITEVHEHIQTPFLQNTYCFIVAPKLTKCRECLVAMKRSSRTMLTAYCRFMDYRKLCYNKSGIILNAGFSLPTEATQEHLNQWLPQTSDPPKDLNCENSISLLEHIGDQFCEMIEQEREAIDLHIGKDTTITWKRIVQGVREMCDVCFTTLFNFHWVCRLCGLAVCIDCYKGRKEGIMVEYEEGQPKNRDQYNWLLCTMRQPHDPEKLVLAQIIPGNALWTMQELLHNIRKKFNIPSYCKCNPQEVAASDRHVSTGICKQLMSFVTRSFSADKANFLFYGDAVPPKKESNYEDLDIEVTDSALKWLENTVDGLSNWKHTDDYYNGYEDYTTLRGNLLQDLSDDDISSESSDKEFPSFSLGEIIESVLKPVDSEDKENAGRPLVKHFTNRYPQPNSGRDPLPIRIYTKLESDLAFQKVPHSWFCNGRLLFLHQADHVDNLALFQEQWKRGQPILVKSVDEQLNMDLWHPDAFCRDFGEERNDLVDCKTGAILKNLPMKKFWEGFECFEKRLTDDNGEYMLLKLKDWPPGEDFSEMLPKRFQDLMEGLPLPEYTRRDGILNLAGRLPSWFVRPDLGPKMYNAYGSALYPTKGTTNLHLDVSDAVNVMVYVGIPSDGNAQLHIEEALKAIDEGGCDSLMRARVRARGAKPGALWHIYNARDADKIRDLLTKVAIERGEKLEAHHDPIHDQSWYLDEELRKRLYKDYSVEGYAIAQCLGDAVFIPAGAPHQVRNLHSCVKVAEDFVSPENIAHCFKLTQEFRNLSDTHTNHEDKLQIKNIIYHVVRDALAHLLPNSEN